MIHEYRRTDGEPGRAFVTPGSRLDGHYDRSTLWALYEKHSDAAAEQARQSRPRVDAEGHPLDDTDGEEG